MAPTATNGHVNGGPALNMQGVPTPLPKTLAVSGDSNGLEKLGLRDLDASLLTTTLVPESDLKPIPDTKDLVFGQTKTEHMLTCSFDPQTGWGTPEIKPYGPFHLDPMSSCFQYCPTVFEGMKAYIDPSGEARLFRPELNMQRMQRSLARVALPPINTEALLSLVKALVRVERRWIPRTKGCSLYIRPTVIGTRASLGVSASDHALLYIIVSPTGPYFPTGPKPVSLLGIHEHARAWPGGTGGFKLGLNYAPGFMPQRIAAQKGYQQVLWLLNDADKDGVEDNHLKNLRITEAGAMNFFAVRKRDDGDLDVVTPPLDGTILPGVTRQSCIELLSAHGSRTVLPGLSPETKLHVEERTLTIAELVQWNEEGRLAEAFCVGTAVIVAPVGRIGYTFSTASGETTKDLVFPPYEAHGPVGNALFERIIDIQEGREEWQGWSVPC
ncbi:branched-chain amino acid aminotransferase II [Punctularia strigosozonata HHB-11173 SS5]|uniref:branched-chain amino acid aminotransferase II n=1 Tax=Punctularia strigosozonata (strain HHB-11173) TaxID=741275 RepID=UPI0004417340|nr:branched-chain amino acid aminotransferase II [Punctularia strigosozonata HHB-11173 SS5]EIN13179.1 branched-chain amino acid aminotransferase II [Punctularia strigosozonata HHB-11173 SS5]